MYLPKVPTLFQVCTWVMFLFALNCPDLAAQTFTQSASRPLLRTQVTANGGTFVPVWQDTLSIASRLDSTHEFLVPWFSGAQLDGTLPNLPYITVLIPLSDIETGSRVAASALNFKELETDLFTRSMREAGLTHQAAWYPSAPAELGERVILKKQAYQRVFLYPIRVNGAGNRVQIAEGISYSLQKKAFPAPRIRSNKTIAANSVLQSGEWFKLGVTQSGIYKLDHAFFTSRGINPNGLTPSTLQVYGNGGGMLPQTIGENPHDDLVENAIQTVGMGDGSFDQGDYVLFYGESPHDWVFDEREDRFRHRNHLYCDTTYYFLTFNQEQGKRIPNRPSSSGITYSPTFTRKYGFHETDSYNPLLSGRSWLGESFDLTQDRTFSLPVSRLVAGTSLRLNCRVSGRATARSLFSISEGNVQLGDLATTHINLQYGSVYYTPALGEFLVPASQLSDGAADIAIHYNKPTVSAVGWLDRIEIEYQQRLQIGGSNWEFHAVEQTGPGQIFGYDLPNASTSHQVWDISDARNVVRQGATLNGSRLQFGVAADSIKHFWVFDGTAFATPSSFKKINNQNLHSQPQADFLIITHPWFRSQAKRLATFHREQLGQTVNIADIHQIYNEFSSGAPDPTAIRDYINLFYVRAGNDPKLLPKYALLMGDGSYDCKERLSDGLTNFIPTYQSRVSNDPPYSYVADDYYGFQDVGEGFWGESSGKGNGFPDDTITQTHYIDVAVGRLPVTTAEQADEVVDKIIGYASDPVTFGSWRNRVMLVADYKEGEPRHTRESNGLAPAIAQANPCLNIDKIFMDNYQKMIVADGFRMPDAKEALIKRMNEGALLVNYTGHGGETGWSNGKLFEISDINTLKNENRYPAFMTATCEFGRWDDPGRVCGAEHLMLNANGGAIAMFTTVRVVFSGDNEDLNQEFYRHALSRDANLGRYPTVGEIHQLTKNAAWANRIGVFNSRNFCLLGDPALTLAYPELNAVVTELNGITPVSGVVDTLASLTKVSVAGEIRDDAGQFMQNYNGDLSVTVFDKPSKFKTKTYNIPFTWQKNRVFNGSASIKNGKFDFEFVVPLDVSYESGTAKISLYFEDGTSDGAGCFLDLYVGGTDSSAIQDDMEPELEVFMNDEKFTDGQMVGQDPLMIARVFDESGINTVGTGIGHELTAVLDRDEKNAILLNEFYVAAKDDYQSGTIEYQLDELSEGEHTLTVKVWDVANNSSDAEVRFIVSDDAEIALGHVVNYPNPFTTNTKFILEHNQHGALLDCRIKIYTVSGHLVKSLESTFFAEGNLYCDLEWDGLDEYGDVLGRGVYVYQVHLKDQESGDSVSKFEKLVLLR